MSKHNLLILLIVFSFLFGGANDRTTETTQWAKLRLSRVNQIVLMSSGQLSMGQGSVWIIAIPYYCKVVDQENMKKVGKHSLVKLRYRQDLKTLIIFLSFDHTISSFFCNLIQKFKIEWHCSKWQIWIFSLNTLLWIKVSFLYMLCKSKSHVATNPIEMCTVLRLLCLFPQADQNANTGRV